MQFKLLVWVTNSVPTVVFPILRLVPPSPLLLHSAGGLQYTFWPNDPVKYIPTLCRHVKKASGELRSESVILRRIA